MLVLGTFSKEEGIVLHSPFLFHAGWNADVTAGTRATFLVREDKGHSIEQWSSNFLVWGSS